MSRFRPHLTYANVIATLALFLALGGGAYAALRLPKNSVGTKQIRKNAVRSGKVKNGSLLAKDFKQGQLPRGPQGLQGIHGAPGAPATRYFATVNSTGTAKTGEGVNAVARDQQGVYNLTFTRDVSHCTAVVTPGTNAISGGTANVTFFASAGLKVNGPGVSTDTHSVSVEFLNPSNGSLTDSGFNIAVFC